MKILVVDDSNHKVERIKKVIEETDALDCEIIIAENNSDAIGFLKAVAFDLLILDLNLPIRKGEHPKKEAGVLILKEITRRPSIIKPKYLIGLTAFEDLQEKVKHKFNENGWVILSYNPKNSDWEITIKNKINYILEIKTKGAIENYTNVDLNGLTLIMKGGGIKGLAYVGALEILEPHYKFNHYVGTSAGSIAALLLASGFTVQELKDILSKKNFNDFKDSNFLGALKNLCLHGGFYKANSFVDWMNELLGSKLNSPTKVSLEDLPSRTTVFASRRDKNAFVFDSSDPRTKEIGAAFAARCSMSIPLIFTPQKSEGLRIWDGGMQNNFPVESIIKDSPKKKFLGLYLGDEIFKEKRKSIFGDLESLITESSDPEVLKKYKDRIIIIDTYPVSTLKFRLSSKEKDFLLEVGRLGAIKHLEQIENIIVSDFSYEERREKVDNLRTYLESKYKRRKKLRLFSLILTLSLLILFFTS